VPSTLEKQARVEIDRLLAAAGEQVCGVSGAIVSTAGHAATDPSLRRIDDE
jgi:hypothetical protein